ncbi:uncharacterized protein DUF4377 [Acinetobacter calcoaceticus]|uniref:Uncharacterized protein DUF4377 n=1 Tax=Acinetobacter calcoaceticus TaxID=471 RepID=A0A4V2R1D6_ACICA|nr:uncharacterized protein DUF4377 [Acinetobacter calcoaceticus]
MAKMILIGLIPLLLLGCSQPTPQQPVAETTNTEQEFEQPEETIYLQVAPDKVECAGYEGQSECLQVKRVNVARDGKVTVIDPDWGLFYESIQGYTHDPKKTAVLKIKVADIDYGQGEPPADAPLQSYVLQKIIQKK